MSETKIEVRTKPNCRNCLGSGMAQGFYAGSIHICSCVTEQLRIITVARDYGIPLDDRYSPGQPEMMIEVVIAEKDLEMVKEDLEGKGGEG